jgi:hypothetical protein
MLLLDKANVLQDQGLRNYSMGNDHLFSSLDSSSAGSMPLSQVYLEMVVQI